MKHRKYARFSKAGGQFYRLEIFKEIQTRKGTRVWRWVSIAIGTKDLKRIADIINNLPK